MAAALFGLAQVSHKEGDQAGAAALCGESLAVARAGGDRVGVYVAFDWLGRIAYAQRAPERAAAFCAEALAVAREQGDAWYVALALRGLGRARRLGGDPRAARGVLEESLALSRALGARQATANTLTELGAAALELGDHGGAEAYLAEALTERRALGERGSLVETLWAAAGVAAARNRPARALRLAGAASALGEATGATVSPIELAVRERWFARLADRAHPDAGAWLAGRAMSLQEAVAYAVSGGDAAT